MTAVVSENIRILLSQYTFTTDADALGEDLTCAVCRKLMIDVYQTSCGCKYCRECIVGYLNEGNIYCRGGKEECKEDKLVLDDNVYRSAHLNKRIMKVRVHCPNRSCVFICPLAEMDDHLRVCGQQPLECPYVTIGCGGLGASKNRIETHLSNETLAHSRLLMEAINNLRNELGGLREGFRMSQLEVASVREKLRMTETAMRGVLEGVEEEKQLRMTEKETLLGQMAKEIKESKRVLMIGLEKQANEIKELKIKIEFGEERMREGLSRISVFEGAVTTMRMEVDRGREERRTVEAEVATVKATAVKHREGDRGRTEAMWAETNRRIVECEERAASAVIKEHIRFYELARTVDMLNTGTNTVAVGRLFFTVDRWSARVGEGEAVWSPYVYSHTNGYKLRLLVYPGGDGDGAGMHVSVYSVVCRGEYDAVLPWPCTHTMTVSLVNQRTNEAHISETNTCCRVIKERFSKPIDTNNAPYGWHSFVSHDDIQSIDGLVVKDSVLLLIVVAPPPVDVVSFTVDRLSARRAADETVWSPHFYSHANGYKVRLKVHPGGWDNGRGTHLSMYSVVCKGEDDGALVWPCRYGVAISLVNQRTNEAHVISTNTLCNIYQRYFNKPIGTDNEELGWPSFVSHADLDSTDGLVVNDSVLFHIALIPPQ